MRWSLPAAALLLVPLLAGCLSDGENPTDGAPAGARWRAPDWAMAALPGAEVDHFDRAYFLDKSTPNFHVTGWDPMVSGYHGTTSGTTLCGGISFGERRLAVTHGFSNDVALMVSDVTDPAAPAFLGELVLQNSNVYDATITADGRFALLALVLTPDLSPDPAAVIGEATARLGVSWRDACGETFEGPLDDVPFSNGVLLVDLADPTTPTIADFEPFAGTGVHSIDVRAVDGTDYVVAASAGGLLASTTFQFLTIDTTLGQLVSIGSLNGAVREAPGGDGGGPDPRDAPLSNLHSDGVVQRHPGTGQLLAYLADWDGGLVVAQLLGDGAAGVVPVASWNDHDPAAGREMTGQIHSTLPMPELDADGRHFTLVGQEVIGRPAGRPSGQVVVLDTTDPAQPLPVARWTLPVDPGQRPGEPNLLDREQEWPVAIAYSTHYFDVWNETLFVSTYHGGVWAVDLDPANWPELPSLGVFLPANASPEPPTLGRQSYGGLFYLTPTVLDVLAYPDGTLVSWDATSGIYTYTFDRDDDRVEPTRPWVEDAWIGA